jgi:hypothetical protein
LEVLVRTTTLTLILAVASTGCYQYFPVQEEAPLPEPGAEVRAQLALPQSLELGTTTISDVSAVEGDVYESNGDTLAVFSRVLSTPYGASLHTDGAVFYFPRSQLQRLEERRFEPVKSGLAVGAIAVGLLVTYQAAMRGAGAAGGGNGDGGGEVAHVVVPLPLSILIHR